MRRLTRYIPARLLCWFSCRGIYPISLMGSGADRPCPRCGRTRYIY